MKNHCQGKNENVCLIVQIEKEEQISVLQALLFKSTRLLHHLTKKNCIPKLLVSKEHKMESPNIQNCYCKKDINLKTVF